MENRKNKQTKFIRCFHIWPINVWCMCVRITRALGVIHDVYMFVPRVFFSLLFRAHFDSKNQNTNERNENTQRFRIGMVFVIVLQRVCAITKAVVYSTKRYIETWFHFLNFSLLQSDAFHCVFLQIHCVWLNEWIDSHTMKSHCDIYATHTLHILNWLGLAQLFVSFQYIFALVCDSFVQHLSRS